MTENLMEMTVSERIAAVNAKISVQDGRFRVATQAGPGTSSATVLYDSADGNRRLQVFNRRSDALACADEMNGRTFKYSVDVDSFARHRQRAADGYPRTESLVEPDPMNTGQVVGHRVWFSDGAVGWYAVDCATCARERALRNVEFPSHRPSSYCESGKHSHCTCDACF